MKWPILILVATSVVACRAPDYAEATPYYGQTQGNVGGRPFDISTDGDAYGLGVTVGWHLGQQAAAMRNLADLRVRDGAAVTRQYDADYEAAARRVADEGKDPSVLEQIGVEADSAQDFAWIVGAIAVGGALLLLVLTMFRKELPGLVDKLLPWRRGSGRNDDSLDYKA